MRFDDKLFRCVEYFGSKRIFELSAGIAFGADAVPVIEIRGKLRGGDFLFVFRGRPHSVGA